MSDYKQAEVIFDKVMEDFKQDKINVALKIKAPEMLRLISVGMYLLQKIGRYQECVDFGESILSNQEIMKRLNPIALFYIFEYTRPKKALEEIL
jgi:hypothetical protein